LTGDYQYYEIEDSIKIKIGGAVENLFRLTVVAKVIFHSQRLQKYAKFSCSSVK